MDEKKEQVTFGILELIGDTSLALLTQMEASSPTFRQKGKLYKMVFSIPDSTKITIQEKLIEEEKPEETPEEPQEEPKEEPVEEQPEEKPPKRKYKKRSKKAKIIKKAEKKATKELKKLSAKKSNEEIKDKIIEVLKKKNNMNCLNIAREIFGPDVKGNQGDGWKVTMICKELIKDKIITQKRTGIGNINTLIDSKMDDSKVKPEIPHPTGETFMDKSDIADKIMDSMLDTPHRTRRELNSVVFGTTHPESKHSKKIKDAIDKLQQFRIIDTDSSGDEPTWFLTEEGEEIAKNKRIQKEYRGDK